MKNLIAYAIVPILLGSSVCLASDKLESEQGSVTDWQEKCSMMATLAESVMSARQTGVELQTLMETMTEAGGAMGKIGQELLILAYDQPRYTTEKIQRRTIDEFRDDAYLECAKAARN